MKNALIIHGHFYQPPRENPWTGRIPYQPSAGLYENWNARITRECYAANAASRVLDSQGGILDIINNYAHISFNFGPTLLAWLEEHAPDIYGQIFEADRASRAQHGGHGNAVAQAYSHIILPLAAAEDARTQVRWGLRDFEVRFGRRSEGMWLPETAVNPSVLDILIEEGVRFIILSPWQAEAYCPQGSQKWKPLGGEPAPPHRAYRIDRPAGSIAVFFYNHQLAHGISFEHYLRSADALYDRILHHRQASRPGYLINIATDGEVYGHHEPFGDMCLAALIRRVQAGTELELTNYGEYLEKHPPTHLVQLKAGEGNRGTSWSCAHGVARWHRDCGCSTGSREGWNQRWRAPLREAMDNLRLGLREVFTSRLARLTEQDPFQVRDRYIEVLTWSIRPEEFAASILGRSAGREEMEQLFALLEGQKLAMFMLTSCAWFFADISGIETIQSLACALRAIELYAPFAPAGILRTFSVDLELAKSNMVELGSGRNILENLVIPLRRDPSYAAALFIMLEVFGGEQPLLEADRQRHVGTERPLPEAEGELHEGGERPLPETEGEACSRRESRVRIPQAGTPAPLCEGGKDTGRPNALEAGALSGSMRTAKATMAAQTDRPVCGIFRREAIVLRENGGRFPELSGEITVSVQPALSEGTWAFQLRRTAGMGFDLQMVEAATGRTLLFDLSRLPERVKQAALTNLARDLLIRDSSFPGPEAGSSACLDKSLELLAFSRRLRTAVPDPVPRLAELALRLSLEELTGPLLRVPQQRKASVLPPEADLDRLETLVQAARDYGLSFDADGVARTLTHLVSRLAESLERDGPQRSRPERDGEERSVRAILRQLELARKTGLEVDLTRAQNAVFRLLQSEPAGRRPQLESGGSLNGLKRMRLLIGLASRIGINVERFKEMFFSI
jgi:hypothetical protein